MHISPEFAGLVAQVFPALLIALLIDTRLPAPAGWTRWVNMLHHLIRLVAIFGAAFTTFACLLVAGSNQTSEFVDGLFIVSSIAMSGAVGFMVGGVLGNEMSEVLASFGIKPKPEVSED